MLWRVILLVAVMLFLAVAYSKFFWQFSKLREIFKFFAFDGPRASAAEQTAHYFGGMMAFAVFNLLSYALFREQSLSTAWYMYLWAAFAGWSVKEAAEILWARYVTKKVWHPHDAFVDLSFWLLGGLNAPLLKMFL